MAVAWEPQLLLHREFSSWCRFTVSVSGLVASRVSTARGHQDGPLTGLLFLSRTSGAPLCGADGNKPFYS